ncbi:Ras- protein Rap-2b [Cichlidogyrus casuarinus]|uniref:Ras- protein Rap-2b n=1 Tax=Cichlidogyrus casuarinus TaxID=1844966 RepID=A0ABD2PNH2_9PLAT
MQVERSVPGPPLSASIVNEVPKEQEKKKADSARVLFLGASKVGKSSIIQRFLKNKFEPKYTATVEDIHFRKFLVKDHLVPTEFVDTSGDFQFPVMLRLWMTKATAFVIVFSNDSAESLEEAKQLLEQVRVNREEETGRTPLVVVCNKSDLAGKESQMICEDKIMSWLLEKDLKPSQFVFASAKSNESVSKIFESLWNQNEASKTMEFDPFEVKRRMSVSTGEMPGMYDLVNSRRDSHGSANEISQITESGKAPLSRAGLFRASMKISRRSSAKNTKNVPKSELTRIECSIS